MDLSTRGLDPKSLGDTIDRLYRAAWALCGSREDAEDLVQETYVRVLSRPRFLRSDDDLGYLLRALRHTFLNQRRAALSRPSTKELPERLDLMEDPRAVAPAEALAANEVYAAISRLPEDFRDALVAVDMCGLSYREAARLLRVRDATVATRLYRARDRIVRDIDGEPDER